MSRKVYDPLAMIPSPEAIRERLDKTDTLAKRLRILLELAERLNLPSETGNTPEVPKPTRQGVARV